MQPRAYDVDRNLLDLDGVRGKGMPQQMGFQHDHLPITSLEDHLAQEKPHAGRNRVSRQMRQGKDSQAEQDIGIVLALDPSLKTELKQRIALVKRWRRKDN